MRATLIFLALVVFLAVALNPEPYDHREAIKAQLAEMAQVRPDGLLYDMVATQALKMRVQVDNYYLFSVGRFDGVPVTVGLLGKVFIITKNKGV